MSTFSTGLGDLYKPQLSGDVNKLQQYKVFPGHVLDVCLDENHSLFESIRDIGKIRFRDVVNEYSKAEDDCNKIAYPLDRSIQRYPYPGEEVIIYRAFGEVTAEQALVLSNIFFYTFVVSVHHNITYNQNPFIGTSNAYGNPNDNYNVAKRRFEKKAIDLNSVRDGSNKTKIYKQLRPQEGDFIIQGRFGNSIRLGSTSARGTSNEWNDSNAGVAGDGIMILRVDRDNTIQEKSMLVSEAADNDDASIYMCTSQLIPLTLACTKEMKSWSARYGLKDNAADAAGGSLATNEDTSELYQKVIDTTKPIDQVYQPVGSNQTTLPQPNQAPTTTQ